MNVAGTRRLPSETAHAELVKKWGQAPHVGMILAVLRTGRRSQSPFFHKLGVCLLRRL